MVVIAFVLGLAGVVLAQEPRLDHHRCHKSADPCPDQTKPGQPAPKAGHQAG